MFRAAKHLPAREEGAYLLRRAGSAALGEAVAPAAAAVEGGIHVLDKLTQVAAALNDGVLIAAVAAGEHGAAPARRSGDGVAQAAHTVAVQLLRDVQDAAGVPVLRRRLGKGSFLQPDGLLLEREQLPLQAFHGGEGILGLDGQCLADLAGLLPAARQSSAR